MATNKPNSNAEIVELVIEAKNLANEELLQTTRDLQDLGSAARKASTDLDKLKIQQDTINSYNAVKESVKELRKEVNQAELAYEKQKKALKENKQATDEEKLAVKAAAQELKDLRGELRSQETQYRQLAKTVKSYGEDAKDLTAYQEKLQDKITQAATAADKLNSQMIEQTKTVRERINQEKELVASTAEQTAKTKELQKELDDLIKQEKKVTDAERARLVEQQKQSAESERVATAVNQYANAMRELQQQHEKGVITSAQLVQSEQQLRNEMALNEQQVKSTRELLRAEAADRKKLNDEIDKAKDKADKLAAAEKAAAAAAAAKAEAERLAAEEARRVASALVDYETKLSALNDEKRDGKLTTGEYIREEAKLRAELNLTDKQVSVTRRSLEADSKVKAESTKNTDLLTQATRRLAQAYTVLLAGSKAIEAVRTSVTDFGDLEAAITKVEKTTGLARLQVEQMADQLQQMASNITPTATNELLRYAEVAGQLGTKSAADILNLVTAADALQNSTNLAGDQAVEMLARILTMTGEGIPQIQNLSSAVVALGNDFNVTEADIVHMTKEIVTGTQEIKLGSAAAAAFATALGELGQPAERSRTAMQRLAGAIKQASITGGEDLQRLSKVTGLTGEQIKKSLGTEPEKVLVAFLKGLKNINDAGGQMSGVLQRMGIDGTEALGVLGTLAGGVGRLESALETSNKNWVDGNAHMREAAKAYANQESALGRLANKFQELRTNIGQAYSDDVERGIKAINDLLKDQNNSLTTVMELLPEMVYGIGDALESVDLLVQTFVSAENSVSTFTYVLSVFKSGLNAITLTMKSMVLGVQELQLAWFKFLEMFPEYTKEVQARIVELKDDMKATAASMQTDLDDIANAAARMEGKSSIAWEQFKSAANEYANVIKQLPPEQQKVIESLIAGNKYVAEQNGQYRELTAALVRANREREIEQELHAKASKSSSLRITEIDGEVHAVKALGDAQADLVVTADQWREKQAEQKSVERELTKLWLEKKITFEQYNAALNASQTNLRQYVISTEQLANSQTAENNTVEAAIALRQKLFAQYQAGTITEQQFKAAMDGQASATVTATQAALGYLNSITDNNLEQAKYREQILTTAKAIDDLRNTLKDTTLMEQERARTIAALRVEEEKLAELRRQQTAAIDIENATYGQLQAMQRQYTRELENTIGAFQRGALTKAEYEEKTRRLTAALQEINSVLGQNTAELERNNVATEAASAAKEQQAASSQKSAQAMSLELAAAQHLNKQYDFSAQSIENLNKRYDDLGGYIEQNRQALGSFWGPLAETSNRVFEQERAAIDATRAYREMFAEVNRGGLTMTQLEKLTQRAGYQLTALSQQQMTPLLKAIEDAKDAIRSLSNTVDEELLDVQDRLDKALGDEQSIIKRKFQKELADYQSLLQQAQSSGDAALVAKAEAAIVKLQQAQKLEYEQQFGNAAQKVTQAATTAIADSAAANAITATSAPVAQVANQEPAVILQLQVVGLGSYNVTTDRATLEKLVTDITRQIQLGG